MKKEIDKRAYAFRFWNITMKKDLLSLAKREGRSINYYINQIIKEKIESVK